MKKKSFFCVETILFIVCSLLLGIYFAVCFINSPESVTAFNVCLVSFVWFFCSGLFGAMLFLMREI